MLYSDIEVDAPRAMHFSDRGAPARGPPMPDLPHAGLGLGAAPGLGLGAQPVNDGSFTGALWMGHAGLEAVDVQRCCA